MPPVDHAPPFDYLIVPLALPERPGVIGLARHPGGDLANAVGAIRAWGASAVVTLLPGEELALLGLAGLGPALRASGLDWLHLPILDMGTPDAAFEEAFAEALPVLVGRLDRGERVLVHCRAGIGRTGAVAARLLVARGVAPSAAIALVRRVRPGAVETEQQERWVLAARRD